MLENIKLKKQAYLSDNERKNIEEKVNYEIEYTTYNTLSKMSKIGGLANVIGGAFVIWALYGQLGVKTLFSWYVILMVINIANIAWSAYFQYRFKNITYDAIKRWHYGLYILLGVLTLWWGSIDIFFIPPDPYYQLYVITFLQVVILSYSFPAIIDFRLALISIGCLILPSVCYHFFHAIQSTSPESDHSVLSFAFGISLLILGGFLLIVCYIGYGLTKNLSILSFSNAALNEKLENLNQFLEQRVKERTQELENSLKLVTFQATHDLLTNLPNKRLLLEYMQTAIDNATTHKKQFAVACFTLNEIERINDAFGHRVGDLVIKIIANRFQNLFSTDSEKSSSTKYTVTLSRKDVFVILLEPITPEEIEEKAKVIFKVVEEPVYIESNNIKLTASIGISLFPRDAENTDAILMNSDAAMLHAKQRGGNELYIHQSDISISLQKRIEVESNLYQAVEKGEFLLQYQPIISLSQLSIVGAEALVRWNSQVLGLISPDEFIPLAEANGLIIPLGEWIMRKSCEQLHEWQKLGYHVQMSINLSAKQLHQKNILQSILTIINDSHLKPEDIELELTEREVFQESTLPILKEIIDNGVRLSIDDFGTGYSGLSSLKLLPISKIKIDKSFLKDVATNADSQAIVSNTINLAKKINVSVLAEGIETKEQLAFLVDHHCDLGQGYYFSRPVNTDVFLQLLAAKKIF